MIRAIKIDSQDVVQNFTKVMEKIVLMGETERKGVILIGRRPMV